MGGYAHAGIYTVCTHVAKSSRGKTFAKFGKLHSHTDVAFSNSGGPPCFAPYTQPTNWSKRCNHSAARLASARILRRHMSCQPPFPGEPPH